MSILIKNMSMPNRCYECVFCARTRNFYTKEVIYYQCYCLNQPLSGMDVKCAIEKDCRHPDCPLVEIPTPHGRLIDADSLHIATDISQKDCNKHRMMEYAKAHDSEHMHFKVLISKEPTIVEAER